MGSGKFEFRNRFKVLNLTLDGIYGFNDFKCTYRTKPVEKKVTYRNVRNGKAQHL